MLPLDRVLVDVCDLVVDPNGEPQKSQLAKDITTCVKLVKVTVAVLSAKTMERGLGKSVNRILVIGRTDNSIILAETVDNAVFVGEKVSDSLMVDAGEIVKVKMMDRIRLETNVEISVIVKQTKTTKMDVVRVSKVERIMLRAVLEINNDEV